MSPRWQTTILPVNDAGGRRRAAVACRSTARPAPARPGAASRCPAVIEAPLSERWRRPSADSVSVDWNARCCVEAATVVTHGTEVVGRAAAGPLLPADAATNTPAAYASRNASSTGSVTGGAAADREVDDVDAVDDGLADRRHRVRAEAAFEAADLVTATRRRARRR